MQPFQPGRTAERPNSQASQPAQPARQPAPRPGGGGRGRQAGGSHAGPASQPASPRPERTYGRASTGEGEEDGRPAVRSEQAATQPLAS